MRVGVEKAVLEDLLNYRSERAARDDATGVTLRYGIGDLRAIDVLERQHALARGFAIRPRKGDFRVVLEVLGEVPGVVRFGYEIELGVDGLVELLHQTCG